MNLVELLAPAKNLESGILAINYGADAVYIGADKFGARAAAANSVADIEALVQYAHKFKAKVFVALNTILYDHELQEAEKLIHQIYDAGADALIIQDMGILKMDIPPIPLHASTQTNNYNPDRINFLDQIGFSRIVLARELSLAEIKSIRKQSSAELEFFVHGALCVSLSGQCYFSQAVTGRSANRGMCSQMCRHPYNLLDAHGNKIVSNSHLLSLKDLNLGDNLKDLIDAGITSLKIEGRLKDQNYVKNTVSYYRKKLDQILVHQSGYIKSSSGKTDISFEPDPERSFSRLSTDYFLNGRKEQIINKYSPKSMGKVLGLVDFVGKDFITVKANETLNNGDGLCYIHNNELSGIRVEKVIDNKVYVNDLRELTIGIELYRNYDHEFNKILEADKSRRKINAAILVSEKEEGLSFELKDEDNLTSEHLLKILPEPARNKELSERNITSQLSKGGSSIFDITGVKINCRSGYFFRISELNEIRRILFEEHEKFRSLHFTRQDNQKERKNVVFPKTEVGFSENIANSKASEFYSDHGVEKQEKALEIGSLEKDQLLMTTRHCVKFDLGFCQRLQNVENAPSEPLYLEDNNRQYLLHFDCKNCMMEIRMDNRK